MATPYLASMGAATVEEDDGILRVRGVIDAGCVTDVRLALLEAIDRSTVNPVLLDLSDAEIGDATGLGVLAHAHSRASRRGRELVITGLTSRTARLLGRMRLGRVLRIEPLSISA